MPKIYCTLHGETEHLKIQEVVEQVCDRLGLEILPKTISSQTLIEHCAFVIADVTPKGKTTGNWAQAIFEIGYARRAGKSVLLLCQEGEGENPEWGQHGFLHYDPRDPGRFGDDLMACLLGLCHKEKIRYNRFPDMPSTVLKEEELPILPKQDLRVENYVSLGDSFVDAGEYEQAGEEYARAILHIGRSEMKPHHAPLFFKRGFVHRRLGRIEETLADYSKSIGLDPEYVDAYIARGFTLYEVKRYEEALCDFQQASRLKPDFTRVYVLAGAMLRLMRRHEEALDHLDKAIELNPQYHEAFFTRGQVYTDLKEYEKAIQDFSQAIALKPSYTESFLKRGLVYHTLKNFDLAIDDFSKALEIEPANVEAYHCRGQSLYEKGYQEFHQMAIKDWQRAIELGSPEEPQLQEKIKNTIRSL